MNFDVRALMFSGFALFLAIPSEDAFAKDVTPDAPSGKAAKPFAQVAQAGNPQSEADIHEQNGKRLYDGGQWAEAAVEYAAAYTNGGDPAMLFDMALCYRRAGNAKRALGLYQRYLLEEPETPDRTVVESRIKELQREVATSGGGARPVAPPPTSASPATNAATYEKDGKRLYDGGLWTEAAAAFEAAHKIGKDPGMLYNMALCYRRLGDAKRALDLLQQYLNEAKDTPNRASVEAKIKELQQELAPKRGGRAKQKSGTVPAKDAATYEQEGKRLFDAGLWAEAAGSFEGAYKAGKEPGMLYNMALCHRRAGNAKRALALYQQFLIESPSTPNRATIEAKIKELQQELGVVGGASPQTPAVAANGAPPETGGLVAGCAKDSECKGTRICEQGRCVEPTAKSAPANAGLCDPPCGSGHSCTSAGACVAADGSVAANGGATTHAGGPTSYAFGGGLGYASGGTVTVGSYDYHPDGGFLADLYVDKILVPAFSMGGYLTLTSMGVSGLDTSLLSLGATMKLRLALSESVHLRPGLTIGYNRLGNSAMHDITGLNVGMHVDLAIATSDTFAIVPRLGFFSQPSGGNSDDEVKFGPHFYLAFALEFGR